MAAMIAKRHRSLAALLFVAPFLTHCAQEPARVVEPRQGSAPAERGEAVLRAAMLAGHNRARAAVGLPPLVWNEALASSARIYAETMARTGRFEHARQSMGMDREGENLWTGTRNAYRYDEMAAHWVAEKRDFVNLPVPQFSRTGRWQDVAHYGQIVSRNTTDVGCALASDAQDDFLVCRYSPPGNVYGRPVY
ncbi:MAG: CAP domain-containing protein [Sphingomonas taxi]